MTRLEDLLAAMIGELEVGSPGDPDLGALVISDVELAIPIESRVAADGALQASWPRGRFATGFDPPLGTLEVRIAVEPA